MTVQIKNRDYISEEYEDISLYVSKILVERIDIKHLRILDPQRRMEKIFHVLKKIIDEEKIVISNKKIMLLAKEIYEETFEYGPVSGYMSDSSITEIMINDFNRIYIEKNGIIQETKTTFKNNQHVRNMVEKLISPLGLKIDESSPMVDARLEDGSRINAVIKPVSLNEILVTIRKFKDNLLEMADLIELKALNNNISDFLRCCVKNKINILVSGGTSSGKTTFLNILSNFISKNERVIVIEETPELRLRVKNSVRLEARQTNIEGKGEITIRDLVRNSLRMRPDRIIVGEIRGLEAVDVLQAMNTGHEGSMTTIHANSPFDLISRLETMLLLSSVNLNYDSVRRIILSTVDLIIQLEKDAEGKRRVTNISVPVGDKSTKGIPSFKNIIAEDIFIFKNGRFVYTGFRPKFLRKIGWGVEDFNAGDF